MVTATFNGPVVRPGEHNVVLRDALLHSPVERWSSVSDAQRIRVGVREGEFTDWIGTWDQSERPIEAATPTSILDPDRLGMRLKENQAIVVEITTRGVPPSLIGSRINFRMGRVGGRSGPLRPLISTGMTVTDPNSRVAVETLERQINNRLSEWEESLHLKDPVELAPTGTFMGRMQVDDTTTLSLQRYTGNWIEVDGIPVSIGADGREVDVAESLLESSGGIGSSIPAADNTYSVYISSGGSLRLSATSPTRLRGIYYLGAGDGPDQWRFVGWVRVNSSTQFEDSETARLCANYYNRVKKDLYSCPGYLDNDTDTTFTETGVTWQQANNGSGSSVEFVSNGEDAVVIHATTSAVNDTAGGRTELGIQMDNNGGAIRSGITAGTEIGNIAVHYSDVLDADWHIAELMTRVTTATTGTYYADSERNGADADVPNTYISGQVLV